MNIQITAVDKCIFFDIIVLIITLLITHNSRDATGAVFFFTVIYASGSYISYLVRKSKEEN